MLRHGQPKEGEVSLRLSEHKGERQLLVAFHPKGEQDPEAAIRSGSAPWAIIDRDEFLKDQRPGTNAAKAALWHGGVDFSLPKVEDLAPGQEWLSEFIRPSGR